MSKALLDGGLTAPTCYYKVQIRGLDLEDELSKFFFIRSDYMISLCFCLYLEAIPKSRYLPPTSSPIFFGAALKDYICLAAVQKGLVTDHRFKDHNVTIHDYDADHWLILSHAKDISSDLDSWLGKILPTLKV